MSTATRADHRTDAPALIPLVVLSATAAASLVRAAQLGRARGRTLV